MDCWPLLNSELPVTLSIQEGLDNLFLKDVRKGKSYFDSEMRLNYMEESFCALTQHFSKPYSHW